MRRVQANGLLAIAALLWGMGNVAQPGILESLGPFSSAGLRCLLALIVIVPYLQSRKPAPVGLDLRGRIIGGLTVLSFMLAIVFQQFGFSATTVTNAGFIVNMTVVLTPIFAWACLSERPPSIIWLVAAVCLFGALLMSGGTKESYSSGDFFCFLSAVFYSLWMVFLGVFVCRHKQIAQLTLVQFAATGITCIVLGSIFETITLSGITKAMPLLVFLGLFSTGLAFLLQSIAQQHTSSSEAAIITSGEAVFGGLGAFAILGEVPTPQGLAGAILMTAGILLLQASGKILMARQSTPLPAVHPQATGERQRREES